MAKNNKYQGWSKEDLIKEVNRLNKRKKYGLVWENKPENVVEQCKKELPVFSEDKNKKIINDLKKPVNLLIEGDNYHALSVLSYTHNGTIDVIYIDPPYNTGAKDWKYNNNYVDANDNYRHSKWLSLMYNRLKLAKKLLKKNGVLVVAIDDNEAHRLRMLLEELMTGYTITSVTIVHNPRGNITNNFARTHEYAFFVIPIGVCAVLRTKRENVTPRKLRRWGHNSTREARPTMFYPIYVKRGKITRVGKTPPSNFHPEAKNVKKKGGEIEIWPIDQNGIERRWNFGLDKILLELDRIAVLKGKEKNLDLFLTHEDTTTKTVWTESELEAGRHGATLVKSITGVNFPYPKSLYNVKKCLELLVKNKPNAIILDFFAGSGTTGHAVLEINNEDGGNRTFILCTNNEDNNGDGLKIATDICYPRIKNVIEGYKDINGKVQKLGGNLKYFRTAFVSADATDKLKKELTQKSTEMLCVKESTYELVKKHKMFTIYKNESKYMAIIYNQLAIPDFKKEASKLKGEISVYIFSLSDDTFEEEFADLRDRVTLSPIPESVLRVYRRIFK